MQNKFHRICTAALAALMSVSTLSGCMSKGGTSKQEFPRVEPPADIWAPYSEEVTVTAFVPENSGTEFQGDDD